MIRQKRGPTRLLVLGVEWSSELEQKLGDGYEIRREDFDNTSLREQNRERAVEVVIVGRQHSHNLEAQIQRDPMGYRSHMSIAAVMDRDKHAPPAPFDGIISPQTGEAAVGDVEHLTRLTEAKRIIDTLYHLSKALGYMETNHPTVEENKARNQLRKCQRKISDEFNQLGAQIHKVDAYALFESVGMLCDVQKLDDTIEEPKDAHSKRSKKGCE